MRIEQLSVVVRAGQSGDAGGPGRVCGAAGEAEPGHQAGGAGHAAGPAAAGIQALSGKGVGGPG